MVTSPSSTIPPCLLLPVSNSLTLLVTWLPAAVTKTISKRLHSKGLRGKAEEFYYYFI